MTQTIAATIGGAVSSLAYMAQWTSYGQMSGCRDCRGGNSLGLLLAVFLAPLAAMFQRGISRTREFEADVGAGNLTQNPRELVSALQKLERSAQIIPMEGNPSFEPLLIINAFSRGGLAKVSALQKLERSAQIIPMEGNPSFEPLLIINAFSRGGLANLFSTHPSTAEHVERLEEQARTLSQAAYTA